MKALVVYSSRTGNTRKIAEAIAAVLPGCEIHPVESAPALEEAAKHPDEADCLRAQEAFKGFAEQVA